MGTACRCVPKANDARDAGLGSRHSSNLCSRVAQQKHPATWQVLADKHEVETLALERAQAQEYSSFAQNWDQRLQRLNRDASAQQKSLLERHDNETNAFIAAAQQALPRPRWSRELLNARKVEEHLARQKEFLQAAQVTCAQGSHWAGAGHAGLVRAPLTYASWRSVKCGRSKAKQMQWRLRRCRPTSRLTGTRYDTAALARGAACLSSMACRYGQKMSRPALCTFLTSSRCW